MASIPPFVVVVDGIIGAGKSTLIGRLKEYLTSIGYIVTIIREPVDQWGELLVKFYEDPTRYSYLFQTMAFHDRAVEARQVYLDNPRTQIFIAERSVFSDTIFMRMLRDSGQCSELEFASYVKWWKMWHLVVPWTPNLFIYLKPTVDTAMKRVANRSRDGESKVSSDYQTSLEQYHDQVFSGNSIDIGFILPEANLESKYVNALHLHTDEDFINDDKLIINTSNKIIQKMKYY